jgi:hypothetical protein
MTMLMLTYMANTTAAEPCPLCRRWLQLQVLENPTTSHIGPGHQSLFPVPSRVILRQKDNSIIDASWGYTFSTAKRVNTKQTILERALSTTRNKQVNATASVDVVLRSCSQRETQSLPIIYSSNCLITGFV